MNKDLAGVEHFIVSKDGGYDPLIAHVNKRGQKVKRVISIADIFDKINLGKELKTKYTRVRENLVKMQKTKRPKSRKTLSSFIESVFQKEISEAETNKLIENLFRDGFMEEKNKRITYLD